MREVRLHIRSAADAREIALADGAVTFGRGETADVRLGDTGLSRLHASVRRDGGRVWAVDEGSTNGTFLNGQPLPPGGAELRDGDTLTIGHATEIRVAVRDSARAAAPVVQTAEAQPPLETPSRRSPLPLIAAAVVIILIAATAVGVGLYVSNKKAAQKRAREGQIARERERARETPDAASPAPSDSVAPSVTPPSAEQARVIISNDAVYAPAVLIESKKKLYREMDETERRIYVYAQAQNVANKIGNRPSTFTNGAIDKIKFWVDSFAKRVGNNSDSFWGEDLRFTFKRATGYTPLIIRAFKSEGVEPAIGVYLPMIETNYHNIQSENFAGAAGLFQFIGPTAEAYGVPRSERTNIEKMSPAAARYMKANLKAFGADAVGVALGIAGYNRNPDSVRRDLNDLVKGPDRDRNFWALIANEELFDKYFQKENQFYVPRFFAAAIIGENPWDFGLDLRPLSTYDGSDAPPQP